MKFFFSTKPSLTLHYCIIIVSIFLFLSPQSINALDNGVALTPPMGWNSWNKFQSNINETLVKEIADAMVSSGMRDAGYQYIVIDDYWQISRDEKGNVIPEQGKFPSGMKALADYVHSIGLKFGLYSCAGLLTCGGRPGGRGYEFQDARQYAEWGVDYLKYDWCNNGGQRSDTAYLLMRDALQLAGRPIVFSICEWGTTQPWLWAKDTGNLWRTTTDIYDCWEGVSKYGAWGVVNILDFQDGLESFAGPGHWNDPDMLEVGNDSLTVTESKAHFSLWCILSAPLIAGNDLRNMTPETVEILTNKEVIAVDQDPLGKQGSKVRDDGDYEVWSKEMKDGSRAVVLLNRSKSDATMSVSWNEIGYPNHLTAVVRDLWMKKDAGKFKGNYSAVVPSHGVVMIKVMP